ncbi:MAG: HEAT repeat domain-containing protein [Deltaproteobacteria bacterium]|nr:HEAT repeat domain-containing protein [Deltaproteobacteria bacterium]
MRNKYGVTLMNILCMLMMFVSTGLFLSCQADPFTKLKSDNPVIWSEAARELVVQKDPRVTDPLIDGLVNGNRHVRKESAALLGEFGDRRGVTPLIGALRDEFWEVRKRAAHSLGLIGDPASIEPLIQVLADEDCDVRNSAIGALTRMGSMVREPLIEALSSGNVNVREGAAGVLASMGWQASGEKDSLKYLLAKRDWDALRSMGAPAAEVLVDALRYSDEVARDQIKKTLKAMGSAATGPLTAALENNDSRVREGAAGVLASVGWQPANQKEKINYLVAGKDWESLVPVGPAAGPALVRMLSDKDYRIRESAAKTLTAIGWRPGNEDDEIASLIAARSWERLAGKKSTAVPRLIELLSDASDDVRMQAATTLGEIHDMKAVLPLLDALGDGNCDVRKKVVVTLGALGDPRAVPLLLERMKEQKCDIREEAAQALEKTGAIPEGPLIEALSEKNQFIREGAAMVLARRSFHGAVDPLIAALADESSKVRARAAHALGKAADTRAVKPLIDALKDTDQAVREEAARALGALRTREATDALVEALEDKKNNRYVCEEAVAALGETGDPAAVKPLVVSLKDGSRYIREKAAEALGKTGDSSAIEPLTGALDDEVFKVRANAAYSLDTLGWKPLNDHGKISYAFAKKDWKVLETTGAPAVELLISALTARDDEPDLQENAGRILEGIGVPSVIPLIAVAAPLAAALTDWWINTEAADIITRWGWKPSKDADVIHLLVARRDYTGLRREWARASSVLIRDAADDDFRVVENSLYAFKNMESKDVIPVLVAAMEQKGNKTMAEAYLNSGLPELAQAAKKWAAVHGFDIK